MVYDLGGGTFDVTLVRMGKGGVLSSITTMGNHKLGGRDWDDRLQEILTERFEEETGLEIRGEPEREAILNGISEHVKKQLSPQGMLSTKVTVSFPGYGKASITVTRKEFEERTADLLERTGALCLVILEEAKLRK